ncbi:MAG: GNAT family N-acetyltransferase, partial [Flavobacterium psychrophilum]
RKILPFVIIDKRKDNTLVGMSSYTNISYADKRIEIGWSWLGVRYQGTGINGIYKRVLVKYAFEKLGFVRVEFKTDVLNKQARKALLKIGAVEEGILRSHTQMHSNRRRDTIYYGIIKDEWEILHLRPHDIDNVAG